MKKTLIIIIAIIVFISAVLGALGIYGYNYYKDSISPVGSSDEKVTLVIKEGLTSREIIDEIYNANLTKNKSMGYLYLKLHSNVNMQAGTYNVDRGMSLEEIINKISSGDAYHDSIQITFVEGKKLTYYANQIAANYPYTEDEIMNQLQDEEYLKELITKYWFLTDEILNDKLYYALEGYLHPNTYQFAKDASIKEIIKTLLDNTEIILNKYKSEIESSDYTIHEILTMASIVELEGSNSDDRNGVAGVFYNRLENGWSLGSDVTTYYAARVEMSERDLYQAELEDANDYNTRSSHLAGKLPVGPICNPSENSIQAALNPKQEDYFYFVADKYGKTYFSKTYDEHVNTINKLKNEGLWYEYE